MLAKTMQNFLSIKQNPAGDFDAIPVGPYPDLQTAVRVCGGLVVTEGPSPEKDALIYALVTGRALRPDAGYVVHFEGQYLTCDGKLGPREKAQVFTDAQMEAYNVVAPIEGIPAGQPASWALSSHGMYHRRVSTHIALGQNSMRGWDDDTVRQRCYSEDLVGYDNREINGLLTPREAAEALYAAGSDPAFFDIDDDGIPDLYDGPDAAFQPDLCDDKNETSRD